MGLKLFNKLVHGWDHISYFTTIRVFDSIKFGVYSPISLNLHHVLYRFMALYMKRAGLILIAHWLPISSTYVYYKNIQKGFMWYWGATFVFGIRLEKGLTSLNLFDKCSISC